MKTIGLCMVVWAWIGHGWYFAVIGWIIFEYGALKLNSWVNDQGSVQKDKT